MEYAFQNIYNTSQLSFTDMLAVTATPDTAPDATVVVENRFGTFEFTAEQMLTLAQGLIGFPQQRRFGLAELPGDGAVNNFRLLQSLDDASLSFIVWPTTASTALLDTADVTRIGQSFNIDRDDLVLLHIVTLREVDGHTAMTLNLKAPVVVDAIGRTAVQHVIAGDAYSVRHQMNLAA
jgi:flagellar assembly factor FliW